MACVASRQIGNVNVAYYPPRLDVSRVLMSPSVVESETIFDGGRLLIRSADDIQLHNYSSAIGTDPNNTNAALMAPRNRRFVICARIRSFVCSVQMLLVLLGIVGFAALIAVYYMLKIDMLYS